MQETKAGVRRERERPTSVSLLFSNKSSATRASKVSIRSSLSCNDFDSVESGTAKAHGAAG